MYLPVHFTETDQAAIEALIDAAPLATLIAVVDGAVVANPLPLIRQGEGLIGHVALANDLHRLLSDGARVTALFHGPDAYVSPNWYPSKAETHQAVPTWNYQLVQIDARITWHHDDASKRRVVSLLTTRFERQTNGDSAWRMGDAPADFMAEKLAGIVALRLDPERVIAKSKLSQNRPQADRDGVAQALDTRAPGVARAMRGR